MHYLNRKVCVRNDRAHSFSRFVEPTLGNQSASQPATHRASSICIRNRTNVLRSFAFSSRRFPGKKEYPRLFCTLGIGKFIPFTNSFPANVIFIGSHLRQTNRRPFSILRGKDEEGFRIIRINNTAR